MSDLQPRDIKPAFFVQKQAGPFTKTVRRYKKVKEGDKVVNKLEVITKTYDHGYMVVFPRGHSIFVERESDMQRFGFLEDPQMIDMNSGDVVGRLGIPGLSMPVKAKTEQAKAA
jgi:hypothetical protein